MRALFWFFVGCALLGSATAGLQVYMGFATTWPAVAWPLIAIVWAFVAESLRQRH